MDIVYESDRLSDVTESGEYEYPDPETAQPLPWPGHTNAQTSALNVPSQDVYSPLEETELFFQHGNGGLDPNVHFGHLNAYGEPVDPEYTEERSETSEDLTSSSESDQSNLDQPTRARGGRGRGKSRGRPRGSGRGRGLGGAGTNLNGHENADELGYYSSRKSRKRGRGSVENPRGRGVKRGFRRPIKPSVEFSSYYAQASDAFIIREFDKAEDMVKGAISQNPEMFEAHALLSEILLARRDVNRSIFAVFNAAHTRPTDSQNWARAAEQMERIADAEALEEYSSDDEDKEEGYLASEAEEEVAITKILEEEEEEEERVGRDGEEQEEASSSTSHDEDDGSDIDSVRLRENGADEDQDSRNGNDAEGKPNIEIRRESPNGASRGAEDKELQKFKKIIEPGGKIADPSQILAAAVYCCTRALSLDSSNTALRFKRAAMNKERGKFRDSIRDYQRLRAVTPSNLEIIRNLAELHMLNNQGDLAIQCINESLPMILGVGSRASYPFGWKDINVYAKIFIWSKRIKEGLKVIRRLSRWMLGREGDSFWEDFMEDDREFDLDHEPRRAEVLHLAQQNYPLSSYGRGLPLDLRIKLGVLRLKLGPDHQREAFRQFEILNPDEKGEDSRVFTYPHLFEEVGDAFRTERMFRDALRFYEPVKLMAEDLDTRYLKNLTRCYRELGMLEEVEECWRAIMSQTENSGILRQPELIDSIIDAEQENEQGNQVAPVYQPHLVHKRKHKLKVNATVGYDKRRDSIVFDDPDEPVDSIEPGDETSLAGSSPQKSRSKRGRRSNRIALAEEQDDLRPLFLRMRDQRTALQNGDIDARRKWMSNARALLTEFGKMSVFFPYDRNVKFLGYSTEARTRALASKKRLLEMDTERAEYLKVPLDQLPPALRPPPTTYDHVTFKEWLDMFLEYAILLAEGDNPTASYSILDLVSAANVWYHSKESMFIIYIVWAVCAIILEDEQKLSSVGRYFMTEYQFVSDSYRLYSALHRFLGRSTAFYNDSPIQKYVLRQIKAVDWSLAPANRPQEKLDRKFAERAGFYTKDADGNVIVADDMDIPLLMLYGSFMLAGGSSTEALNYLYRAHALDPEHPMINLSLAIGYATYAMKRQSLNRQAHVAQSFSFLFKYREARMKSEYLVERQEAEFNVGRLFQMLGLVHLALEYYQRVLGIGNEIRKGWEQQVRERRDRRALQQREDVEMLDAGGVANESGLTEEMQGEHQNEEPFREDFSVDAAYALQDLYAAMGDMEQAQAIVDEYMVL